MVWLECETLMVLRVVYLTLRVMGLEATMGVLKRTMNIPRLTTSVCKETFGALVGPTRALEVIALHLVSNISDALMHEIREDGIVAEVDNFGGCDNGFDDSEYDRHVMSSPSPFSRSGVCDARSRT